MGVFQSGINNILMQAGVGAKFVSDKISQENEAKIQQQKDDLAKKEKEAKSISDAESKINEAIDLSMGYSNKEIMARNTAKDLGINYPQKNPRGVSNRTKERREANAESMKKILSQYAQNADFRERLNKYSAKDIAGAITPQIRSRKKIGGESNAKK